MYGVEMVAFDTCHDCHVERMKRPEVTTELMAHVIYSEDDINNPNTVAEAIHELFQSHVMDEYHCETTKCLRERARNYPGMEGPPQDRRWVLRAALAVLNVRLLISDDYQNKLDETLVINERLDLTQYQTSDPNALPLRYTLSSIISHAGPTLTEGHYIASVRSPGPNHFHTINDGDVQSINRARFLQNPQRSRFSAKRKFQVYILTYFMSDQPQPVISASTARELRMLGHIDQVSGQVGDLESFEKCETYSS